MIGNGRKIVQMTLVAGGGGDFEGESLSLIESEKVTNLAGKSQPGLGHAVCVWLYMNRVHRDGAHAETAVWPRAGGTGVWRPLPSRCSDPAAPSSPPDPSRVLEGLCPKPRVLLPPEGMPTDGATGV